MEPGTKISGELQKRMNQSPDQYTLAWWREQFAEVTKGYRGATHAINRALAEYEDNCNSIRGLQLEIENLKKDRDADRAKIGELQERVDRMAEFLNTLKTKAKP